MINQQSVLENIEKEFGGNVSRKIQDDVAYKSNIYVLYVVSIHKVTEEDLRIGFASYQARFPQRTYESFLKYKRNWDADKYTFDIEPMGYFLDKQTAIYYAESNMGDIYEAGSFPYVIISEMPLNRVYPTCNTREHMLFHFNDETKRYEEIGWDFNEGTMYLEKRGEGGAF